MKALNNTWLATSSLILTALVCSANVGVAAEKVATDPTGTWKVARGNPENKTKGPERTLKLKLEDGKLTGTIDDRSNNNGKVRTFEWPIKETKFQGNDISFSVTHPRLKEPARILRQSMKVKSLAIPLRVKLWWNLAGKHSRGTLRLDV